MTSRNQCLFFFFSFFKLIANFNIVMNINRRQDSSIGFGAPVRSNMRTSGVTNSAITSSLLESVRTRNLNILISNLLCHVYYVYLTRAST